MHLTPTQAVVMVMLATTKLEPDPTGTCALHSKFVDINLAEYIEISLLFTTGDATSDVDCPASKQNWNPDCSSEWLVQQFEKYSAAGA